VISPVQRIGDRIRAELLLEGAELLHEEAELLILELEELLLGPELDELRLHREELLLEEGTAASVFVHGTA
jgi:hypothetical protein